MSMKLRKRTIDLAFQTADRMDGGVRYRAFEEATRQEAQTVPDAHGANGIPVDTPARDP